MLRYAKVCPEHQHDPRRADVSISIFESKHI
jgi:hypothetical protein